MSPNMATAMVKRSSLRDRYPELNEDARPFALIWYDDSVSPKPLDDLALLTLSCYS